MLQSRGCTQRLVLSGHCAAFDIASHVCAVFGYVVFPPSWFVVDSAERVARDWDESNVALTLR